LKLDRVGSNPASGANQRKDKKMREVEVGDRFEDNDPRQGNRVVRIVERDPLNNRVRYEVEVAEFNPKTIGRKRWIAPETLYRNYKLISR
jgi:hypothetical protein